MHNANASAEMLIYKPVSEVFSAFVNPRIIEKFWLKSASAPLTKNAIVEWEFMVQGAHEITTVIEFLESQTIAFTWSDGISVTIRFNQQSPTSTIVSVNATGFKGVDVVAQLVSATEGFTIVLCNLKSFLETGQPGNMVRDKAALISAAKTNS
ncbi:MAG TPA: SRPBCC domain-containing protein [Cellvibrionaceae bacterium]